MRTVAALSFAALASLAACAPGGGGSIDGAPPPSEDTLTQEGEEAPSAESIAQAERESAAYQEPNYPQSEASEVLKRYAHLDPKHRVPDGLLEKAVLYYNANKMRLRNPSVLSVIDFSKHSSQARFFIINIRTGSVLAIHVAHGSGSDPGHDGIAERFSNRSGSNASSLGFYRASETYYGKHGLSLRLDGMSSTNSAARARAVVIHSASYVRESNVKQGRSWGCPAVAPHLREKVINALKGGSLIYAGLR